MTHDSDLNALIGLVRQWNTDSGHSIGYTYIERLCDELLRRLNKSGSVDQVILERVIDKVRKWALGRAGPTVRREDIDLMCNELAHRLLPKGSLDQHIFASHYADKDRGQGDL